MKKLLMILMISALCLLGVPMQVFADMGDVWTAGTDYSNSEAEFWAVESDGDLVPGTDSNVQIGASGTEVEALYVESITLGGVAKTSWGSVVSPMTDESGYVNPTDAGGNLKLYDDGDITIGGAAAADVAITWDGNADDWYIALDDSADDLVIGYGSTIGTDNRIAIVDDTNLTKIVIGDAQAYDQLITFDGAAQDYSIGLDDTADDFIICLGSALGTTTALGIDENLAVATYGDVTMGGTTPVLTVGDAGAEDAAIVYDGNAQDFYIALDDSADDLLIGVGATIGTTPAISITDGLAITTYADMTMTGTTPILTIGDGGTEDTGLIFDGVVDFSIQVDDSRDVLSLCTGTTIGAGTSAISIDANQDVTLDAGSLYFKDDEFAIFGTGSDWTIQYDEAVDDQLLLTTTTTTGTADTDALFQILFPASPDADQDLFEIGKGADQSAPTSLFSVDEDGDIEVAGTSALTGVVTFSADPIVAGTTPTLTIGDAGAEDAAIAFDGNAVDFRVALDDSADSLEIGLNGTIETDERITIGGSADTTNITIGDAAEFDMQISFDGAAQDFTVGLDDTADDLVICVGTALGTTTAMSIDENTDVTIVGNLEAEGALDIGTLATFGESDDTPDVSDGSYFVTHATTDTITDFDGAGIVAGQIIVVESAGAITYDVTTTGLKGGSTDIVTADGDLTSWVYNGTDWLLIAFMDLSDDMS